MALLKQKPVASMGMGSSMRLETPTMATMQKSISGRASNEMDIKMLREIREERRNEEKDPLLRKAGSEVEMQQMAMRFVPDCNARPLRNDPINLFERIPNPVTVRAPSQPTKGVEFVHILEPTFPMKGVDSLATVPSTVMKRFSNDSVRGSALSTRLSDMPSMYSQALVITEEPSTVVMSPSAQEFDISPQSVSEYREKWLTSYMSGYTPKETVIVSIINMITRRQVELRVCKDNTLNEVCHMYMQYEDHPEYYVWKDIYGRLLNPEKTLVENGLMRQDEVLEFQGYRKTAVILLYFRDGFESDPPLPLNPLHALKQREPGLCRNY